MRLKKYLLHCIAVGILTIATWKTALATGQCDFRHVFTRPDENGATSVKVYEAKAISLPNGKRPLLFITSFKVNTDGTKISYHKDDPTGRRCATNPNATPCAINNIRNAYRDQARPVSDFTSVRDAGFPLPKTWRVLSPDIIEKNKNNGKPCITQDGCLVSMTTDVAVDDGWNRVGDCDQSKWIDALTAPGIVLPKKTAMIPSQFIGFGINKRSLVVAISSDTTHKTVFGIVGDYGPAKEIGEANIAMNRMLNGLPDNDQPKHRQDVINRFQAGRTAVLLFPRTDFILDRPITGSRIADAGENAFSKFGSTNMLVNCIHDELNEDF